MTSNLTTPETPAAIGYNTYGAVLNELDRERVAWTPNEGDKVVGKITSIVTATSEFGSYPLITLDPGPDEPLVDVHCFHSYLKSDVTRAELREGDILGIKYLDRGGARNAARYRISVQRTGTGDPYKPSEDISRPTDQVDHQFEEPF